jgi:hypothetical protein
MSRVRKLGDVEGEEEAEDAVLLLEVVVRLACGSLILYWFAVSGSLKAVL